MFKFGRPNKLYDENLVHDFVQQHFEQREMIYATGMTMNYMISVDPAAPFHPNPGIVSKYAVKVVNPNFYGTLDHNVEILPTGRKTYWSDGSITRWEDEL